MAVSCVYRVEYYRRYYCDRWNSLPISLMRNEREIEMLDEYGLSRDDFFETMSEMRFQETR